ncbi:Septum formation [Micromonospora pallida]|uniref:Septum formation n=1 Tax=Micromonospora pallida TaxID=145854 RepID=A0A1C6SLY5_9ACTN|nr:septum formation family protein [Micromonospora pallida]SCL30443.1 Septum formation [Micromonospora pallida]
MRRWLRACALSGVAALALAGCGVPDGTDGDLFDEWADLAAPTIFQPAADTCHPTAGSVGHLTSYNPVPCEKLHEAETVLVGTLPAEHSDRATPPPAGSPARLAAYGECEKAANRTLGADWRSGRIALHTILPSDAGWRGGARWFRCDVAEVNRLDGPTVKGRTGSLKGALSDDAPLAHRCFNVKLANDKVDDMAEVSCTTKHDAEFVGVYRDTVGNHDELVKGSSRIHRRCQAMVAKYAKVPDDGNLKYRTGTIYFHPSADEWQDGNRGVQCFLWLSSRSLTRSVKGGGTKALPIRYA